MEYLSNRNKSLHCCPNIFTVVQIKESSSAVSRSRSLKVADQPK
ncbi:hypothetical protein AVDCRST_MAG92-494 [uncultured Coleofasciculus sp.]|uniref:Uncharacterized protein n=1 Tax=uncultured Coleofasciculus sp. TaxID=1267456 RepID=A0A6J4HAX3_9CYAN|nr:hypothetical protein AVDCRST_MAG92-494 [uncultured Coleofasciculus sp.]